MGELMVIARVVQHSLVVSTLVPGTAAGVGAVHAQMVGGDIRFGIWTFLHSEHERWPEIGGRLRLGWPAARTQLAGGFFIKGGGGCGSLILDAGPLGDDSENGLGLHIGTGYDVRLGNKLSPTPVASFFWGNFDDGQAHACPTWA